MTVCIYDGRDWEGYFSFNMTNPFMKMCADINGSEGYKNCSIAVLESRPQHFICSESPLLLKGKEMNQRHYHHYFYLKIYSVFDK